MIRKNKFKKAYLCFVGVLAVLMAVCFIYVGSVLGDYEDSQPEARVEAEIGRLMAAAAEGKLDSAMSLDGLSDTEIAELQKRITSAKDFSSKLQKNEGGGESLVYSVLADGVRIADVHLTGTTGKTKLIIFPMTEWKITSISAAEYEFSFILPASMKVIMGEEEVSGEEMGNKVKYDIKTKSHPSVTVRDSLGVETEYDGSTALSVTEYVLQIPSNYIVCSSDGSITVPASTAEMTNIDSYKYVSQYTDMPKTATYRLGLFDDTAGFIIKDNLGNTVDKALDGHTLKIEGQASLADIPEDVFTKEDVLSHARKWSLFMTADLTGANHGYAQVEEFLLPDSYLRDVAYKWATGVDITFTSVHRLDNPPFSEESVSNYIKYSDNCFSVDVKLTKMMHLNSGDDVADTMNCRFYYVNNGGWYVADIEEIIG